MGLNLDLSEMFALPQRAFCPNCRRAVETHFDDFDIEAGDGIRNLRLEGTFWCDECEFEFPFMVTFTSCLYVGFLAVKQAKEEIDRA